MSQPFDEPREQRRRALLAGLAVLLAVLLLALVSWAVVGQDDERRAAPPTPTPTSTSSSGASSDPGSLVPADGDDDVAVPVTGAPDGLEVAATIAGALTLGRAERLRVTVTNTTATAVVLDALTLSAATPDRVGCRASWLRVSPLTPDPAGRTLAPGASADAAAELELVDLPTVNQDACRGATFPLRVKASGASS